FEKALSSFGGYKVLFIQDEYDNTEIARQNFARLGFHAVFSVVPEQYLSTVYPKDRFPHVDFISILTGYVSPDLENYPEPKPISERTVFIGYRGRELPHKYGDLAREKLFIGQKMREICLQRDLPVDIEWAEDKRIYGPNWYTFLENCR